MEDRADKSMIDTCLVRKNMISSVHDVWFEKKIGRGL